jgi:hypothetical protein
MRKRTATTSPVAPVVAPEAEVVQAEETQPAPAAPAADPERVEAVRARLAVLKAEVAELEGELASLQVHMLITSTVEGPCAMVRKIFLAMHDQPRSVVIRKCVNAGIAANTAKTQYQLLRQKLAAGDTKLVAELYALLDAAEA